VAQVVERLPSKPQCCQKKKKEEEEEVKFKCKSLETKICNETLWKQN
jgi:hypothetical protein